METEMKTLLTTVAVVSLISLPAFGQGVTKEAEDTMYVAPKVQMQGKASGAVKLIPPTQGVGGGEKSPGSANASAGTNGSAGSGGSDSQGSAAASASGAASAGQ